MNKQSKVVVTEDQKKATKAGLKKKVVLEIEELSTLESRGAARIY